MAASESPLTSDPLPDGRPLPFNCPKCGEPLRIHTERTDDDGHGLPELVCVYFCFLHGFFNLRNSKGLTEGL